MKQGKNVNAAVNHLEMKPVNALCGKLKQGKQDSGAYKYFIVFYTYPMLNWLYF